MIIRNFQETDLNQLKKIHEQFYQHEFSLDDFCQKFMDFFIIEESDQIICAGGVRAIAEAVIVTNKNAEMELKKQALYQMLHAASFSCEKHGFKQLHAFVQNKAWERRLIKNGFARTKGNALFIGVD
jgi:phosphoglycerate-specific signal transduction histidine kinase